MYIWFFVSILGTIAVTPLHFLSVEHLKLQERYGIEKGIQIGKICGLISGWGLFLFWMGIWLSPQPRFIIPILQNLSVFAPICGFSIPLFHLIISTPFLIGGSWIAVKGVKEVTLQVAETHRTETIITTGSYSVVRHPQYLGGLLAHAGISLILSAWFSLLFTPLMVVLIYLISRKEEEELIREFGNEYRDYKKRVPMLIPRLKSRHQTLPSHTYSKSNRESTQCTSHQEHVKTECCMHEERENPVFDDLAFGCGRKNSREYPVDNIAIYVIKD